MLTNINKRWNHLNSKLFLWKSEEVSYTGDTLCCRLRPHKILEHLYLYLAKMQRKNL
jgi:hypothetical protein